MKLEELNNILANKPKGAFTTLTTKRPLKVFKNSGVELFKESTFQLRVGHSYNNQKEVKEKHESGEREKVGLPDYLERLDNIFVKHKKKQTIYLSGQPAGNKSESRFLDNKGNEISWNDIQGFLLASEKRSSSEKSDHVRISIDNIIEAK